MQRHGCAETRDRSRGVIRRHLKFMGVQNTRSRVAHWLRNASGRTVTSLLGTYLALLVNLTSSLEEPLITCFTMIARSTGAVIRWQRSVLLTLLA